MTNATTEALRTAQVETTATLWGTPTTFTPAVLSQTFGDGRALFRITTINDRPRWWVVRGCTTWTESHDPEEGQVAIADVIDDIVQAIADEFGGLPNMDSPTEPEAYVDPSTDEPFDPADLVYPQIDDRTGTFWDHLDWPDIDGVTLEPHPRHPPGHHRVRVLAERVPA